MQKIQNKIQLITYADSLGGDLKTLKKVLEEYFQEVAGGVHILPFYPSSSDRGFSPLNQTDVDARFGDWEDVSGIAGKYELMADLMVNHLSKQSPQFQDYLQKGDDSPYADWFISAEKFSRRIKDNNSRKWLSGKGLRHAEKIMNIFRKRDPFFHEDGVNKFALKKIYRPRPGSPFVEFAFGDGKTREIWCTFSDDQIDLDIENGDVKKMFVDSIKLLASKGARFLRLDAVGYAVKKRGTTNFMVAETFEFIKWLGETAHQEGMVVVPEIHHHYENQIELAKTPGVDFVYDFALPMLVLRAIYAGDCSRLKNWINIRPENQITTLDTHDGIGVIDVNGLMSQGEIDNTVNQIKEYGGNATMRAAGEGANNVDTYQLNSTYFSALGADEDKYLIARAVQFFVPGIPQIFYTGLLAGENDEQRLNDTGVGRELMRHNYTMEEIERSLSRKVVQELMKLMKFRNTHVAFGGNFLMKNSSDEELVLRWDLEGDFCELKVDFSLSSAVLEYSDPRTKNVEIYKIV